MTPNEFHFIFFFFNDTATTEIYTLSPTRRSSDLYAIDRMRQRQKEEARREAPRAEDRDGMENDPLNRVPDGAPTPERLTQSIELRKQMEQALAALSDAERTAFVMRHWEGCGIEEIAGVLKSSCNATKNTVFRAVQKFRRALPPLLVTKVPARLIGQGTGNK